MIGGAARGTGWFYAMLPTGGKGRSCRLERCLMPPVTEAVDQGVGNLHVPKRLV
jgi:hypothetical protein